MRTFCLLFLVMSGCLAVATYPTIEVRDRSEEMRKEVLRFVTIGMPIDKAFVILEKQGFTRDVSVELDLNSSVTFKKTFDSVKELAITIDGRAGTVKEVTTEVNHKGFVF